MNEFPWALLKIIPVKSAIYWWLLGLLKRLEFQNIFISFIDSCNAFGPKFKEAELASLPALTIGRVL